MRNMILILVILAFTSSFFIGTAFAGEPQTKCPVMEGGINKQLFADYNGKRVYFCCPGCPDEFKKNPEKYIKKLEDQGVELEKTPAAAQ